MKFSKFKVRLMKNFLSGIAIGVGILTSGLLAVAVSGTFNTFSSGQVMKSSDINANFNAIITAINSIPNWTKSGSDAVLSGKVSATNLGTYCGNTFSVPNGGSFTSGASNGSFSYGGFTGIKAAKKVCEVACGNTAAHICTGHEAAISAQLNLTTTDGWIHSMSYYYDTTAVRQGSDCEGFTTSNGTNYAGTIMYGTAGRINGQICNQSWIVLCCL